MSIESSTNNINFLNELKERFSIPFKPFNYAYFGYLVGILIGFGGLGIWVSIFQDISSSNSLWTTVPTNISTYFIALLASSFIDLNVLPNAINRVSMLIYSVIFLGVGFLLFWLSINISSNLSFIPATLGFIFAILTWHIANCDSDKFNDDSFNTKIRTQGKGIHGGDKWNNSNSGQNG